MTSKKDQEQYWKNKEEAYRFITPSEFSDAFKSFHIGIKLGDELGIPFDKSKSHRAALTTQKYGVGKRELLKACFSREILLMKRNSFVYIFKLFQVASNLLFFLFLFLKDIAYQLINTIAFWSFQLFVMALITMSVFLRTEMHRDTIVDGGIYTGALFFTVIMIMFNGLSELSLTTIKLPNFYKQRDLLFYPSWAYSLPNWILKIPITFIEVALWVVITYYGIGFDPNIER